MNGWIIGVGAEGAALARRRAESDGRSFLAVDGLADPRILDIAATAESLYVVVADLSQRDVLAFRARVDGAVRHKEGEAPDVGCPVGFLHAARVEVMRDLDQRQRQAAAQRGTPPERPADVVLDCTLTGAPGAPPRGMTVLPYRGVTRDALLAQGPMRLLALTAHGMSDLVHLDADYVCGRSRYATAESVRDGALPSCMDATAPVCVFKPKGTPLAAYELPAEHIFLNSCGSSRYEAGEFGDAFSIWYSALEGTARSFAGSIRWKEGHGLEGVLYRHLLNAGYPLGRALALVDRALSGHGLEEGPVYTLIGDPEERPAGSEPRPPMGEFGAGRTTLALEEGFGYYLVRDPDLVDAFRERRLMLHAVGQKTVSLSAVPSVDGTILHVFVAGYESLDSVTVRCVDFRLQARRLAAVRSAFTESLDPALGIQGIYPDRVRQGGRLNVENRLLNTARLVKRAETEQHVLPKLLRNYETLEAEVARLDSDTAAWLLDRIRTTSYRFSEQYQETFRLDGTERGAPCHLCGGPTVDRRQSNLVSPHVRRTERICPGCGGLDDVPDAEVSLRLSLPRQPRRGEDVTAALLVTNHTDRELTGHCFAAVRKGADFDVTGPEEPRQLHLPAHSENEVEFAFRFGPGMAPHQYDIQAALVSTAKVYMARCPVWLA